MRISVEKNISSLQIGFNVPLKDSKYKTLEQRFSNVPLFSDRLFLYHESRTHWSAELPRKVSHLSDGVSERVREPVSEFAVVYDNPFITLRVFTS